MPATDTPTAEVLEGQQQVRILVVDDEAEAAALMTDALSSADATWCVEAETDPARAADRLTRESFDCLITDLVMPTVGGLRLAEQARSANPNLAIIAITGCSTVDSSIEALRLGFDDYLEKPFDLTTMQQAVSQSLQRRHQEEARDGRFAELAQAKTQLETANAQVSRKLEIASQDLVRSNRRLARRLDGVARRADVARTLMGVIELEDLLGLCAELVGDRVACDSCTVALYETRENAVGLMVRARPERDDPPALSWLRSPITAGVMCRAAQTTRTVHVERAEESRLLDDQERDLWPDGRLLVVPIPLQGLSVGTAVLHRPASEGTFNATDVQAVTALVQVMAPAIQTAKAHHRQRCQIYASLEAVADGVERHLEYLKGHTARVVAYAMPVAETLELPQSQIGAIQIAARLHDIGLVSVPDSAVNHPGPLTEPQWDLVRRHPETGTEFLKPLDFLGEVGQVIRAHHESYDGTGYPDRKAGEEIPAPARVITLADAFDAMTSPRPHREAMETESARDQVRRLAGQQFDPRMAEAFLALPPGLLTEIRASHR